MKTALKCVVVLLLSVIAIHCNTQQKENATLIQIMRDEDGTVYRRVYRLPGNPDVLRVEEYFKNGILKEVYFRKNGQLNGPRELFYTNGILSESGTWRNDNRIGEFRYYKEDGQLDCIQYYGLLGDGSR